MVERGDYYDALRVKHNEVIPLIHETYGGMAPDATRHLYRLARDSRRPGRRDGTKYTGSWTARGFTAFHAQRISAAIVVQGACAAIECLNKYVKQKADDAIRLRGHPAAEAAAG